MRRIVLIPILLAALAACGGEEEQQAPPPPELGVVVVQPTDAPLRLDLVGRLAPYRSADVRARVPGVVQRRVYQEGSDVAEGQVLFEIDPAPLRAAAGEAQAALAQARANQANARASAARARSLAPQKYISQSDLDNALAAERSANAAVQAAQSTVESANINLGYATVRAPIAGRAGKQQVTEGALVGQGTATLLTTVDQIDPMYVNFSMGAGDLDRVRGMGLDRDGPVAVQVLLPDGSVYAHPGVMDFSGDVVDPETGAVSLRATLPNPDRRLLPGTYVTLVATLGVQHGVYQVPQAAVQRDATGPYVLVVGADGNVARKDVTTARAEAGNWIVTDGLAAGDQVVVSGLQRARVGEPATAAPVDAAGGAGAPGAKPAGPAAADRAAGGAGASPDPGQADQATDDGGADADAAAAPAADQG
ncbi:efflux RND transporter periplasmic adaptor subunit [Luteimonas sp. MC1750]|uniref:efflux RND transporter periplasmic adaptor subunit n=1 Tax=Luteimonas sp. MC1750 TaxID=2799326 RepID=UPI0018F0EB6F|nr:efflux RND transporter periplasmic adaptor subunit [Luteimonas sp. MC1750]MBJ6983358.1 efflux RND transporter periplasmic adaptor subunit [Luteimonas sp. MC1750]QQO06218.1 efflux RND transporter periplasmic adaptor subunit [Luteimonas sp. MC1750]